MYNKKESIEDYLEKILMLEGEMENIRAIDLAKFMSFSKASVSVALKKLKSYGYLTVDEDKAEGVRTGGFGSTDK